MSLPLKQFLIIFMLFVGNIHADGLDTSKTPKTGDQAKIPGIVESLEKLFHMHHNEYKKSVAAMKGYSRSISGMSEISAIKLDPVFMRSVLLHSSGKYTDFAGKNECLFYSLLENNLLRSAEGNIRHVLVNYKDKNGHEKVAMTTRNDFLQAIYKTSCADNLEITKLFNRQNIKSTLDTFELKNPSTEKDCSQQFESWKFNPKIPSLCKIPETIEMLPKLKLSLRLTTSHEKISFLEKLIQQGNYYLKNISRKKRYYLENICHNLNDQKSFCNLYLFNDFWKKMINGVGTIWPLSYKCQNLLNKEKPTKDDLEKCRKKFIRNPAICKTKGAKNHPSLIPHPDCNQISKALEYSHLKTDYHDCPGNVDNEGIINLHRIMMHLSPRKISSDKNRCANETNYSFAKMNIDFKNENAWPMKVCFYNKRIKKNYCKSFIPGHNPSTELSETKVVAELLKKMKKIGHKVRCRFVDSKTYNPTLLEFKNKCFIVYDLNHCTTLHCLKKIFFKNKEVKNLKYSGIPVFDYFPNSFRNEKFSASNILEETYKIRNKSLTNLTEMMFFLNLNKNNIIHGIGCAEDILPSFFEKTLFNQCRPLPFIIDGYLKKNNNVHFITRTAVDDLHSPRIINWNFIFASVSSYKEIHPLRTWTLYGIKK